jgi:hypothetical protein
VYLKDFAGIFLFVGYMNGFCKLLRSIGLMVFFIFYFFQALVNGLGSKFIVTIIVFQSLLEIKYVAGFYGCSSFFDFLGIL